MACGEDCIRMSDTWRCRLSRIVLGRQPTRSTSGISTGQSDASIRRKAPRALNAERHQLAGCVRVVVDAEHAAGNVARQVQQARRWVSADGG